MNVFFSYARADYAHVLRISAMLKRLGIATWIDTECLDTRHAIESQLQQAIQRSKVLILLDTENARRSPWVAYEVGAALKSGTPIVRLGGPEDSDELMSAVGRARPNFALQLTRPSLRSGPRS
jgi:hypothetical protein